MRNIRNKDPVPSAYKLAGFGKVAGEEQRAALPQCIGTDLPDEQCAGIFCGIIDKSTKIELKLQALALSFSKRKWYNIIPNQRKNRKNRVWSKFF